MTNYVVDASIVVQILVTDKNSPAAEALFSSVDEGNQLIVPEFGLMECANVLWKQVRFHNLNQADAEAMLQDLIGLDMIIMPTVGLMPRALAIGLKYQLAVYDSVYIALAEHLGYALITDDKRQAAAAQAEGVTLKAISDFAP